VTVDGSARGVVVRDLKTGELEVHTAHAVLLCTGGYSNVFFLSTNAMKSNATAAWRAHRHGALFANPCYTQIHPTCIPAHGDQQSKLTLMSESLRNDGRVWVPAGTADKRAPGEVPEEERDYFLERKYPTFGNLVPRDIAARNAKYACDEGRGVGATGRAVYLDFKDALARHGEDTIRAKYGNLFHMYEKITGVDPYKAPMQIYPAPHYTMGGLWVDYNLMSNVPGLFVLGEANYSDHGANRLGASALMQGLADGYFVIPYTLAGYLAGQPLERLSPDHAACKDAAAKVEQRIDGLFETGGSRSPDNIHRELGLLMLDKCGMSRSAEGLDEAREKIRGLQQAFSSDLRVVGSKDSYNPELEKALRVSDFLELAELMVVDARHRNESCGGHFREEYQTEEGEAQRNDEEFTYVAAWEHAGAGKDPTLHKEHLNLEFVKPSQRSYK
jgi:succinate dehydrogenase / fumarate reductase, flavoprotein subunit